MRHRIYQLGDAALTVEFGSAIAADINAVAICAAATITNTAFEGLIETVSAYCSTTVFYDILKVRNAYPEFGTAFEAVSSIVERILAGPLAEAGEDARTIEIPVDFSGEDLDLVAEFAGISTADVVELFISVEYRVYMLGFLPGFAYMGEVDDVLAVPRRANPRTLVKKGSVGIAGRQTGIYPFDSPGGWQIIGYTPSEMFTPKSAEPCLLRPGDKVRFTALNG